MSDLPNLDAARAALEKWANFCGGENPPEPDPWMLRDALAVVDALTARLAEAPAVVVTQGVGFTEERLRREEAERRLDEAYEYAEREREAGRREGLEEAQRIAADLSGAYREKHGGGGDYCAALSALTMALVAALEAAPKETP